MYKRTEHWKNGSEYTLVPFYTCDNCEKEICDSDPKFADHPNNYHLCWDCGFIKGYIEEQRYLRNTGVTFMGARAEVRDGKVIVWVGKKAPWEMTSHDERRTSRYRKWRSDVLERDGNKCKHCGSTKNLQAHHKKLFSKYKDLRYVVSNGLTLCEQCHRKVHRKNTQKVSGV